MDHSYLSTLYTHIAVNLGMKWSHHCQTLGCHRYHTGLEWTSWRRWEKQPGGRQEKREKESQQWKSFDIYYHHQRWPIRLNIIYFAEEKGWMWGTKRWGKIQKKRFGETGNKDPPLQRKRKKCSDFTFVAIHTVSTLERTTHGGTGACYARTLSPLWR